MLDLKQNYFELFALPATFVLEKAELSEKYRSLQQAVHPDKFATAGEQEKRFSMQAASFINEAYRVLNNDLKRAVYILSLNGIDLDAETDTKVDPLFLMEQMSYRERLDDVFSQEDSLAAVDTIRRSIVADVAELVSAIGSQLTAEDYSAARDTARKWQFLDKLNNELDDVEHQFEEAQDY